MGDLQRPLMAVVAEPEAVPMEQLEEEFLREAWELAARWASRLPDASAWRAFCAETQRACADSLDGRRLLRALRG